ncbi:MAG: hypothetical protein JSU67_09435 [Gammaproteobacteria bacterium]|nr:MAG: hypothetical protein JSU67_09435 [Gammaproteobacteria bacterium]
MIDRSQAGQFKGREYTAGRRPLQWRLLRLVGWVGVFVAIPFFVWVPAAWVGLVPSMVDVFSVVGLRTPASITIGGLLLAAIGFHKF